MQTLLPQRQQQSINLAGRQQSRLLALKSHLLKHLTPTIVTLCLFSSLIGYLFASAATSLASTSHSTTELQLQVPTKSLPLAAASSHAQLVALEQADLALYATRRQELTHITHLILVAGHAVYTHADHSKDVAQNSHWELADYQKKQVQTFLQHIARGLQLTSEDPNSLLVFTGGFTRRTAAAQDQSESQSYLMIARHHFPQQFAPIASRVTTEITSRDSFENLLHAVCRYRERVGRYPERITAIGFEFKRRRFEDLHLAAMRWPKDQFSYVGIDSDEWSADDLATVQKGEKLNSFEPFSRDIMGCHSSLQAKRDKRNPHSRNVAGIAMACPALSQLMSYCPDDASQVFQGQLPWSKATNVN